MIPMIPVAGTWGLNPDQQASAWWRGDSPWLQFMAGHQIMPVVAADPFIWSTDLGHNAWRSGGQALEWYKMLYAPQLPVRVIAHSHGLQVALYAAMLGAQIDTLVSLSSPIRTDMEVTVVDAARPNIRRWLHVRAEEFDKMDWSGTFFEPIDIDLQHGLDLHRHIPMRADLIDTVPGISHSNVIYDPTWFYVWEKLLWINLLQSWE
jgi:hypothetical protein